MNDLLTNLPRCGVPISSTKSCDLMAHFADYRICVELDIMGGTVVITFEHTVCGYIEELDKTIINYPIKYLMVKATEHHMEKHSNEKM